MRTNINKTSQELFQSPKKLSTSELRFIQGNAMKIKQLLGHTVFFIYSIFKRCIARIWCEYARKSLQSVHLRDIVTSFLCYFDLESLILYLKNRNIFIKICFNETLKVKTTESMIIRMARAFHPINDDVLHKTV